MKANLVIGLNQHHFTKRRLNIRTRLTVRFDIVLTLLTVTVLRSLRHRFIIQVHVHVCNRRYNSMVRKRYTTFVFDRGLLSTKLPLVRNLQLL